MGNRDHALKLMHQAVQAAVDKSKETNMTTAYQLWASACIADPTYGLAWYQYGTNNFELKRYSATIASYRRALDGDLDDATRARLLVNMGWAYHLLGDTKAAYDTTLKAGELSHDATQYWLHRSVLEGLFGNTEEAVRTAEIAVRHAHREIDEDMAKWDGYGPATDDGEVRNAPLHRQLIECKISLAFALLFDGQYERGFEMFENRFEWRLHSFLQLPYPRWQGETDKTIFLIADQGLGDTLSFARFTEQACKRARYVHAYIQPELMRIFNHVFTHIPNLNLIPAGAVYPQADAWTTFVSLPYALKLTDAQVRDTPQIKPSIFPLPTTWMVPDAKLHIGISWAGSPLNDIDKFRNIPVTQFLDLYQVPGVQLYGLQIGDRAKELHEHGCVSLIRDLSPYVSDVASTVALLKNLDLVICCESALGHICALAGKECWIPYSFLGRDYRIGARGEKLMWTPKHRIFRQGEDNRWEPVFEEIVRELRKKVHGKR